MNDAQLVSELQYLGIDPRNAGVVALLPLVQVAWVDGAVQAAERSAIVAFGEREDLDGASMKVLEGWLNEAPSELYHHRGRGVIRELAMRNVGVDSGVTPEKVDAIVEYCSTVASCAGGLFGVLFTVSEAERRLLTQITEDLYVPTRGGWADLLGELKTSQPAPERPMSSPASA